MSKVTRAVVAVGRGSVAVVIPRDFAVMLGLERRDRVAIFLDGKHLILEKLERGAACAAPDTHLGNEVGGDRRGVQ